MRLVTLLWLDPLWWLFQKELRLPLGAGTLMPAMSPGPLILPGPSCAAACYLGSLPSLPRFHIRRKHSKSWVLKTLFQKLLNCYVLVFVAAQRAARCRSRGLLAPLHHALSSTFPCLCLLTFCVVFCTFSPTAVATFATCATLPLQWFLSLRVCFAKFDGFLCAQMLAASTGALMAARSKLASARDNSNLCLECDTRNIQANARYKSHHGTHNPVTDATDRCAVFGHHNTCPVPVTNRPPGLVCDIAKYTNQCPHEIARPVLCAISYTTDCPPLWSCTPSFVQCPNRTPCLVWCCHVAQASARLLCCNITPYTTYSAFEKSYLPLLLAMSQQARASRHHSRQFVGPSSSPPFTVPTHVSRSWMAPFA